MDLDAAARALEIPAPELLHHVSHNGIHHTSGANQISICTSSLMKVLNTMSCATNSHSDR